MSDDRAQLTIDSIIGGPAPDDAGAETAARYRFQAEVVARDAIAVLLRDRGAIICEWHEDAIVLDPPYVTLVSVKHREPSQGAWTRAKLISEGGLKHLFGRWRSTGQQARCRLSTNAGLKADAQRLRAACASGDTAVILRTAEATYRPLGATDAHEAALFLQSLRIEDGLPDRRYIATVNIGSLMNPVLRRLGIVGIAPEDAYQAIVSAVETASRDRQAGTDAYLDVITDPNRLDTDAQTRQRLRDRTLDVELLKQALAGVLPAARHPRLAPATTTRSETNLAKKLKAGGFGATAIRTAKQLRASWTSFAASYSTPFGEPEADLTDYMIRLRREAGEVETAARDQRAEDGTWGRAMYGLLKTRLRTQPPATPPWIPDDEALTEGLIYELTDQCEIWWSDEFDLDVAS